MTIEQTTDRAAAIGAVEEANAAIGASLSTGEPQTANRALLSAVQTALADVAAVLDGRQDLVMVVDQHRHDLERALTLRTHGRHVPAPTRSLPARHSLAAGLLRLARTVTQRAARSVEATDSDGTATLTDYLTALPPLLDLLAAELDDAEERSVPVGSCIELATSRAASAPSSQAG
jgi:cob(I)alamin adenosyltransferase